MQHLLGSITFVFIFEYIFGVFVFVFEELQSKVFGLITQIHGDETLMFVKCNYIK